VIAYLAFLGMLMATGIDIALPAFDEINADLDAGSRESLIVTLYVMGAAVGQLVVGPVSDWAGRRVTVLGGLVLYIVGAVVSALAPSYVLLLVARFAWGLGAAAPMGLRNAIARDLYSGDAMARVATIMMAVFLLGPVFTPLIGDVILSLGSWRFVFWFAAALGIVALAWAARFGETLPPERRRPLAVAEFAKAVRRIGRTRVTLGHLLANVFFSAAFFIFLGSSQPVFDRVFGRADQFAVWFAVLGLCTIPLLIINNGLIKRFGGRRMSLLASGVSTTASVAAAGWALAVGPPSFWPWYVWLIVATSFVTLATPVISALALDPMGDLAGTVSSLLYFTGFAIGALLAALVDARIEASVTPFLVGFAIFMVIGYAFQMWAGAGAADTDRA